MRICGIDQGISTGIVVVDAKKGLMYNGTIRIEQLKFSLDLISKIGDIDEYVVERLPRTLGHPMGEIDGLVELITQPVDLVRISPGEWKPVAKAKGWLQDTNFETQHEVDAYCMVRFHILKNTKFDAGIL